MSNRAPSPFPVTGGPVWKGDAVERLVLTSVHVVDVITGQIRRGHGIVIENGRIRQVAPMHELSTVDAEVADGGERYVVPGLADMHVHFWDVGEAAMYLANGVTTVRNMFGAPSTWPSRDGSMPARFWALES